MIKGSPADELSGTTVTILDETRSSNETDIDGQRVVLDCDPNVQSTCSCDYGAVNWKCGYPHHSGCKADKGNYSRDTDRDCRQVGGTEGDGGGETLLILFWWHLHLRSGKHHVHLEANWRANREP